MCFEQFLGCVNTLGIAFSRPGRWRSRCPRNSSRVGARGAARGGWGHCGNHRPAERAGGTVRLRGVQPAERNAAGYFWGASFIFLHGVNGVWVWHGGESEHRGGLNTTAQMLRFLSVNAVCFSQTGCSACPWGFVRCMELAVDVVWFLSSLMGCKYLNGIHEFVLWFPFVLWAEAAFWASAEVLEHTEFGQL